MKRPSSRSTSTSNQASDLARAPGASERGPQEGTSDEAPGVRSRLPERWRAQRKVEVVLRLLRGESLDALSREIRQPASRISQWREEFLHGGAECMKSRAGDPAFDTLQEERRGLRAKIGEQAMEIELLREKIHHMEANLRPPVWRRPSR